MFGLERILRRPFTTLTLGVSLVAYSLTGCGDGVDTSPEPVPVGCVYDSDCAVDLGRICYGGECVSSSDVDSGYEDTGSSSADVGDGDVGNGLDCVDADDDGFSAVVGCSEYLDCDDSNKDISPAAIEYCNGIDDTCDGEVDGGYKLGEKCLKDGKEGVYVCDPNGLEAFCSID